MSDAAQPKLTRELVLKHLEAQTYDRYYQDIEALGIHGYVHTSKTWDNIADLVDWKDKSVVEMGCFHGYFCFQVEQRGASPVTGLDHSEAVLRTTRMIAELQGSRARFLLWKGGEATPVCDVALCLNMLHHCNDPHLTLQNMRCRWAVFEIKPEYAALVEKYFKVTTRRASHRDDRLILLAGKRARPLSRAVPLPATHTGGGSDFIIALMINLLNGYVREVWRGLGMAGPGGQPLRIAVFGAGAHTEWLERITRDVQPAPRVTALLDDRGAAAPVRFGLSAIRPEQLDPATVAGVLLSSDTVAEAMLTRCRALYPPDLRIIRLYQGFPPGPYPKDYFDSRLQRLS